VVEQYDWFCPLMAGSGRLAYNYAILSVPLILQMQPLCKPAKIVGHQLLMM
jgi:hypothetical protein